MDAGEKTQYDGEDGPGRNAWWYTGCRVMCEILRVRIKAGTPPTHTHTLWYPPSRHSLVIVYGFPPQAFLSFPWTFSCLVFHIFWLLLMELDMTAWLMTYPAPTPSAFFLAQQNLKFSQASGPVQGGENWVVQTIVFYLGCTLKAPGVYFKKMLIYGPHSQKFWFNWSGMGIKSS